MSINSHLHGNPCPEDDIESMLYTLISFTIFGLPWHNVDFYPAELKKKILNMKLNFDHYQYIKDQYEFLANCFEYLKMVTTKKEKLNYEVLKELLIPKNILYSETFMKYEKFCFIEEIKIELKEKINSNEIDKQENKRLENLFIGYPLEFKKLLKDLN